MEVESLLDTIRYNLNRKVFLNSDIYTVFELNKKKYKFKICDDTIKKEKLMLHIYDHEIKTKELLALKQGIEEVLEQREQYKKDSVLIDGKLVHDCWQCPYRSGIDYTDVLWCDALKREVKDMKYEDCWNKRSEECPYAKKEN